MKITLNIETNDPADLERIAAALAGKEVAVQTGKAREIAGVKSNKTETAPSAGAAQASQSAQAQSGAASAASGSDAGGAVPSDADLIAAANAATGKVGAGGADKIKSYIATNFKKADGSPGTLKMTAEGRRGALLEALQKIGRGEITL